ncbi:tyrosine-type recombinase/integrase [Paracoccus sp. YIM 132242]|uniref:Tyrosine-type recombinase/integrase n=1 Tax=Paracoccus lichenicola TaxID=2665644 RepID=A0A6L6HKM3_9RHOB|nr:site-specific integrase [Paracoccus lichenicola]MTD98780.1 tyrosine-type recombinase/integrase [Paracoccus lichenicola]
MARVSYLYRRGAIYYARIDVPKDLVSVTGTTTWKESLRTKDETEAKRLLPAVVLRWQREFDDLRARRALMPGDRENAVWDHYSDTLARDDQERAMLPGEAEIDAATEQAVQRVHAERIDIHDPLAMMDVILDVQVVKEAASFNTNARKVKLAEMRKHLAKGETALIADEVDDYLRRNRLFVDHGTPDWISLARHMMRAEIEALQRTLERDQGDYTGQPADPLVKPATGPRRETAKPGESIMEIFEIFARENPRGVAKDRVDQCRRDIGTFIELVGASFPIAKISKAEVRDWKQLLVKYPVKATETKAFAGMNIQQIVKKNEEVGKPVIADRTVNRYLSSLSAFLSWAVNNGYLERNPIEGLMLKKEAKAPTLPFKTDQLQTLFKSPWFAGCQSADEWRNVAKPGNVLIRDHRFWVPLIMLFSGARPGEIGQLALSDVRQEHGHWIMHITTEGDETVEGKSVKTAGSMRVVPVHPELISLGFIDYHAKRLEEGGNALFPGAVRNERGQMLADVSRESGRYLTKIGLKNGRGLSLYSFRHGAADALRRAGYLDNQFGFILGHTEASMTGRYGIMPQGMLEQRVELVKAIAYPELDLSHLMPN